jgi:VWFA-related protein
MQATPFLFVLVFAPLFTPASIAPAQAFVSPSAALSLSGAPDSAPFADGLRAINESRWADAVSIFSRLSAEKSSHADGALYWKAYAENKLGQAKTALDACTELRRDFPRSRWIDECGALEIEIRAKSGQPVLPQAIRDENLKLLALNALMRQDEAQALAQIRAMLAGDASERLKTGAVHILAQSTSKPALTLLRQIAQRKFTAAALSPAVLAEAATFSLGWMPVPQSNIFTLDAVVTDKAGQPVTGLTASDFTLLDNKQPQTLLSVQEVDGLHADPPPEVILVIDSVNTPVTVWNQERVQLEKFLLQNNGQLALPTTLLFLTDQGADLLGTPTRDGNKLQKMLHAYPSSLRLIGKSAGPIGEAERQWISLRALDQLAVVQRKKEGRKLLLWISPGWSSFWAEDQLKTKTESQRLFTGIVSLSAALREARMTLYSIDPMGAGVRRGNFFYQSYLNGVSKADDTHYGGVDLGVLAAQSGGQVLFGSNDIVSQIDRCLADAKDFYVLRLKPAPAAHLNEYHDLSLTVAKPGLTVRTRTGYYLQP